MRRSIPGLLVLTLAACGGAHHALPVAPAPNAAPSGGSTQSPAAPPVAMAPSALRTLSRSAVREVVARGLGAFLQRIELDDHPVFEGGSFRGFRVAKLLDAAFWNGVDLRPGDVVTRVNGRPIERPEQAQAAFESLNDASELRVTYERNGQPREIVYPIVGAR